MNLRGALCALAVGLAAGCVSLPRPTDAHAQLLRARFPEATLESLTEGRRLYQSRCSGCHLLYAPSARSAADWGEAVAQMQERSRLSAAERGNLLQFLAAFARDATLPPVP